MSQKQENNHMKHRVELQIRFNDIDGLGHVNNSVYAQYFDMGRMRYFEMLKGAPVDWKNAGLIIASTHTEFMSPIFLKDEVEVSTAVTKVGNKSLQMSQGVYDRLSGELKATCQSVMVGFNPATSSSMRIPDFWRNSIASFEADVTP